MRVGVDGRSLTGGIGRGVSRVTFELLAEMAARFTADEWLVLLPGSAGDVPANTDVYRTRLPGRVVFGFASVTGRPRLDAMLGGIDVAWLPAPAPVALSRRVPWVLTLHDISWVERPGDFTRYERVWHRLARTRSLALHASWIAAVSEQTRRSAIERWGVDGGRITVIRPPVKTWSQRADREDNPYEDPYFLWVGALEPRKAPEILERAWSVARSRGLEARLVVVGDGRIPLTGQGVQRLGRVTDAKLDELYDGALALVMPSLLEGAGLPPLEAGLHGTPSICSDLAVLRESLGEEGAEWVRPADVEGVAEALLGISRDPERRQRIAAQASLAATARTDPGPAAERMRALLADAARA